MTSSPQNPMDKIHNIVYVMFENRSFDALLGWMYDGDDSPCGVVNIPPIDPKTEVAFNGLTPKLQVEFSQPGRLPFHDETEFPIVRGVSGNWFPESTPIADPHETFEFITDQVYGNPAAFEPTMKGFLADYAAAHPDLPSIHHQILQTYDRDEAPVINALGAAFGVSDEWFCSIPSQTSINRAFSVIGNSVGYASEDDAVDQRTTAMVNNVMWGGFGGLNPAPFIGDTVWNVLAAHGYPTADDWKIYYSDLYFNGWLGHDTSYSYLMFHKLRELIDPQSAAARTDPRYQPIEQFYADADAGCLPRFSYIEPKYTWELTGGIGIHGDDYHPPSDIRSGENFLAEIYTRLANSPQWENTLLVVAFDEHGGTFDHVSPPTGAIDPGGAECNEDGFGFDRYGVRVPMLFISPWVAERTVIRSGDPSRPFDHTSWLATLLHWFGLDPELLGARTAEAPRFDAVVGDTRRPDFVLPLNATPSPNDDTTREPTSAEVDHMTKFVRRARPSADAADVARRLARRTSVADLYREVRALLSG